MATVIIISYSNNILPVDDSEIYLSGSLAALMPR